MSIRQSIDYVTEQAKEFAAEAFQKTARLGVGGFEGYMKAAIRKYGKDLRSMEDMYRLVAAKVDQETYPQAMIDLVSIRTGVQVLKQ